MNDSDQTHVQPTEPISTSADAPGSGGTAPPAEGVRFPALRRTTHRSAGTGGSSPAIRQGFPSTSGGSR